MTDICACNYPAWLYDKDGREYFAIPESIAGERGVIKRLDLGDREVILNRDGADIKFLTIPMDTIDARGLESIIPEIEIVDHESILSDGSTIVRQFMKVVWLKVTDEFVKKYDIRGHIFVAGCKPSETIKEKEFDHLGKEKEVLKCSEKDIFVVFHPLDEFLEKHIGELEHIVK